ncbi:hypothetical protein GCM10017750_68690 [Streptomyces racemochromogenes]
MLTPQNPQVSSGQQPHLWVLPVLVAVLAGGAGSQLPLDVGVRVGVVIVIVIAVVRGSLRRGIA